MAVTMIRWMACTFSMGALLYGQAPASPYRDRAEYELAQALDRETDAKSRLSLIQEWARRYPDSQATLERDKAEIRTLQQLGRARDMLRVANDLIRRDPLGEGNYWICTLTTNLQDVYPEALKRGDQAARELLRNLRSSFALDRKPMAVSSDWWYRERDRYEWIAHRTRGWVALAEKRYGEAERELVWVLQHRSDDAEAAYWLGNSLLASSRTSQQERGLYCLARSLVVTGQGELNATAKQRARQVFEARYNQLQGSAEGMMQLLAEARRRGPLPPADYRLPPVRGRG